MTDTLEELETKVNKKRSLILRTLKQNYPDILISTLDELGHIDDLIEEAVKKDMSYEDIVSMIERFYSS